MRRVTACVILLMAAARLRGDQMSIVSVTEDLMARRGDSVNMTCLTDQGRLENLSVQTEWI